MNTNINHAAIQLCHTDLVNDGTFTNVTKDLESDVVCCVFKSKPHHVRHFIHYNRKEKAIVSATTVSKPVVEKCKPSADELERIEKLLEVIVERELTLYALQHG